MGSGKGKSKRAQASASSSARPPVVVFREKNWEAFLQRHKLETLGVQEYYGVALNERITPDEVMKVFEELFADAVEVKAIGLPEGYSATDFVFKASCVEGARDRTSDIHEIGVYLKGKSYRKKHLISYWEDIPPFKPYAEMRETSYFLRMIKEVVKTLVAA